MSAAAAPYGMIPVESLAAGVNTQGFQTFLILDGYTTSIYFGDVVKIASSGLIQKDTGTTALTPMGVFVGCSYIDPTTGYWVNAQSWPASLTTGGVGTLQPRALVVDNPNGVFQIQADGSVAQSGLGMNASIVQTAGTAQFGKSRNALSAASVATTDGFPLRIVGFVQSPENAVGDAFTDVYVKFTNHQLTATLGV